MNWLESARLGIFIRWGHSSRDEWELSLPSVGGAFDLPSCRDLAKYHFNANHFNPIAYNPRQWATIAKSLGVEYVILTVKHHDGFTLFPTNTDDFYFDGDGSDLVKQFVEAMREANLKIGFYFSLVDWHHPAFTEEDKPDYFNQFSQSTLQQWSSCCDVMFEQIRELLTNYGQIDVIWFDGRWERTPQQWRADELGQMIRQLQPNILINDRLPGQGDFATPEQFVPPQPAEGLWQIRLSMNDIIDNNYNSARDLVHILCEIAGKGGNMLLNVSPMGDGQISPAQTELLQAVAEWMSRYGESILDTQPGLEPWQFYGSSTRRDNVYYLHLLMKPYETISVRGMPINRIESVKVVGSEQTLAYTQRCSIAEQLTQPDPKGELIITVPESIIDPLATVISIELAPSKPHLL